jgi:hypothetical protein
MSYPLAVLDKAAKPITRLDQLAASARVLAAESKAENTRLAYKKDWAVFESWCAQHKLVSLPADASTLALFVVARAEGFAAGHRVYKPAKMSTITRQLAAISQIHLLAGHKASPPRTHGWARS